MLKNYPDCDCQSGLAANQCCAFPDRNALNAPVYATWNDENLQAIDADHASQPIAAAAASFDIPLLFPAEINFKREKLYFVKITPVLIRQSVFLDPARIRASCVVECDLHHAATLADRLDWPASSYIFHTAFCGSTLLTKALDLLYLSLPLREPDVLGNVYYRSFIYDKRRLDSQDIDLRWLDRSMRLLARRFDRIERSVIKVNDYVNPLMHWLPNRRADTPMLFMFVPLEEFYVSCSKAENRKQWLKQRISSLQVSISEFLPQINSIAWQSDAAAQAAIYWSYNLVLYLTAYRRFARQLMCIDFNELLANPVVAISACAEHLKLTPRLGVDIDDVIRQLFGSYSKNDTIQYSPQQRQQEIILQLNKEPTLLHRLQALREDLLAPYQADLSQGLPNAFAS